jgi:transposase
MVGEARYLTADRSQLYWDMVDLEGQLPLEHRARVVWAFVTGLDLSELYAKIGAREGEAGRPPADPRILLALWLYATLEGVGSARHLARLCERDVAYRWLRGGVPVNYHGLSDFRVDHGEVLDRLLSESVAALLAEGVVTLEEVAIDGTKVQAAASRRSFHREARLMALEAAARARVAALKAAAASDPGSSERQRQAARRRGAQAIAERAAAAQAQLERLREEKAARARTHPAEEATKGEERASSSDPEARLMRFADGATRPGYNIQLAVAPGTGLILGTQANDRRNDAGLAVPMVEQLRERFAQVPQRVLVDTHYATADDMVRLGAAAVEVFTPVPADKADAKPESVRRRAARRQHEPDVLQAWRARMASEAGRETYARRFWSETVNGILKGRDFALMRVRSLAKVTCVVLLHAIAHNLWRAHCLRRAAAQAA